MSHIVTCVNQAQPFYLRGTTWTFHRDRAQEFDTVDTALKALERAKPFMKAKAFKSAYVADATMIIL